MQKFKHAFTMVELVFVIVILGILAAVAIPRLAATRDDATIAKGRADIASIRSAIATERQARLIKGMSTYVPNGAGTYTGTDGNTYNQMDRNGLFGGILTYPIVAASAGDDGWSSATSGTYTYTVSGTATTFDYNTTTGRFTCSGTYCSQLTD